MLDVIPPDFSQPRNDRNRSHTDCNRLFTDRGAYSAPKRNPVEQAHAGPQPYYGTKLVWRSPFEQADLANSSLVCVMLIEPALLSKLQHTAAENTSLREQVHDLQQQVTRLATAAAPPQPAKSQLLPVSTAAEQWTALSKIYGELDTEQTAFLQERPHLIPALLRTQELIYKFFDRSTKLALMLTDQDSAYPNLFIQIHTSLPQPEAAARSEQFEESWFNTESAANLVDLTANLVFV